MCFLWFLACFLLLFPPAAALDTPFGLKPVFLPTLEELLADQNNIEVTPQPAESILEAEVISIAPTQEEETPSRRRKIGWLVAAAFLGVMFIGGLQIQENSANIASFFSSLMPGKIAVKEANFLPRLEDEKINCAVSPGRIVSLNPIIPLISKPCTIVSLLITERLRVSPTSTESCTFRCSKTLVELKAIKAI